MYDKYLIKEGETLEDIASRFNTSVDMILNINDIYSREYLRAGEEIIVPKNQESYFTYYTVNQGDSLYKIATRLKFNEFLYLGNSEIKGKEQIRKAILADSVEAVIAAMYLDSNLEEAQRFIIDNLKNEIEVATKHVGQKDYKTVLQEKLQAHGTTSIKYEIIDEKGPDHAKIFVSQVEWNGKKLAIGEGKSKKIAEMEAARKALELLK